MFILQHHQADTNISATNKLLVIEVPELIPYRKKDKWGFCTPDKKIVIECKYDNANRFSENSAEVELNGIRLLIDKKGTEISPLKQDDLYNPQREKTKINFYIKRDGEFTNETDEYGNPIGQIGFIDKFGKEIVYDSVGNFAEGLTWVKLNDKYGFIDNLGNEVISLRYDDAGNFNEGLTWVKLNDKYGFIDNLGNEVIPLRYDDAVNFQ